MRSWRAAKLAPSTSLRSCARLRRWRRILRARAPRGSSCRYPSGAAEMRGPTILSSGTIPASPRSSPTSLITPARFPSLAGSCALRSSGSSARKEPEGEAPFDRVVITVDDDGPGIPPHALERIFERFYTDRPSQGFGQNSGLGLSISRQIVEAHGGRIWACNRAESGAVRVQAPERDNAEETVRHGAGARFVVELPAFTA